MPTRRKFLGAMMGAGMGAAFQAKGLGLLSSAKSFEALAAPLIRAQPGETLITILHTNDTHSQIDPLPANDKQHPGMGGVARRATLIKRLRRENPNSLLVDAGDVFQGTPYFNFFRGEVEYKAMSAMGYDVGTLGNHEFDNGVDSLAAALKYANFELVNANYDMRGTPLENRVKPYVVRDVGGVRVGLFGMGFQLEGYYPPDRYTGIKFLDRVSVARDAVRALRERERCALVVCLSHMGYYEPRKGNEFGDSQLVAQVDGIDFIASGHSHIFMEKPVMVKQPSGRETMIFQVGKSGIYLGRVDFTMRAGRITASAGRLLDLREANS
jgi:5'-nucleotidase